MVFVAAHLGEPYRNRDYADRGVRWHGRGLSRPRHQARPRGGREDRPRGPADADRVLRFEREAKVLASLNHPRIASLYGMEQANGRHFLVMELVEGETLADRLRRGPMPVEESLTIARQIAEALEAAHEKGVVHRDLKPANVKITPDEKVKVLDFGLAKVMEIETASGAVANSPTLSMMATQAGMILGTAAYMSPEQAKGFPARSPERRVLVRRRALRDADRPPAVPGRDGARRARVGARARPESRSRCRRSSTRACAISMRRCLEESPKRRWQAIGDVRTEIEAIGATPSTSTMLPVSAAAAVVAARDANGCHGCRRGRPCGPGRMGRDTTDPTTCRALHLCPARGGAVHQCRPAGNRDLAGWNTNRLRGESEALPSADFRAGGPGHPGD